MNQQASHQNEADMVRYYARRATEYERIYHKPERQKDLHRLKSLLTEYFRGEQVLEIACGTGYWTSVIAQSASAITAMDATDEVLAIARQKPLYGAAVSFQRGDAYRLDELGSGFTAALAAFWWSHIPRTRLKEFLIGLHTRLKPGAKVAFVDNRYVEGSSTPISRLDDAGNSYQRRPLDDGSEHEVLKNFPSPEELREVVAGSATDVSVTELPYFWLLTYRTV